MPPKNLPILAGSVLAPCLLVCFINGCHLSKCFSKILHQDLIAKTIYIFHDTFEFSVEQRLAIYILPCTNVSTFLSSSNIERQIQHTVDPSTLIIHTGTQLLLNTLSVHVVVNHVDANVLIYNY